MATVTYLSYLDAALALPPWLAVHTYFTHALPLTTAVHTQSIEL